MLLSLLSVIEVCVLLSALSVPEVSVLDVVDSTKVDEVVSTPGVSVIDKVDSTELVESGSCVVLSIVDVSVVEKAESTKVDEAETWAALSARDVSVVGVTDEVDSTDVELDASAVDKSDRVDSEEVDSCVVRSVPLVVRGTDELSDDDTVSTLEKELVASVVVSIVALLSLHEVVPSAVETELIVSVAVEEKVPVSPTDEDVPSDVVVMSDERERGGEEVEE